MLHVTTATGQATSSQIVGPREVVKKARDQEVKGAEAVVTI
jgi:hypothetical protein